MNRKTFMSLAAPIAGLVGVVALFFPTVLLEGKGVVLGAPVVVWMREVGILILSLGIVLFLVRNEQASRALRAIFIGNVIVQFGLLVIEVLAYQSQTITEIWGIIPNCVLHILLLIGFVYFLIKMPKNPASSS